MLLKTNQNFSPQSYRVCRLFAFGWHCVRRHNRFTFLHHTVLPHLLCVAFLRKPFTIYFIFVSLLCGVFFSIPIYSVIWCILSLAIFTIHLLCVHNVYTQSPLDECFYILLVEHLDQIVWGKVFPQNTLPMHIGKEWSEKKHRINMNSTDVSFWQLRQNARKKPNHLKYMIEEDCQPRKVVNRWFNVDNSNFVCLFCCFMCSSLYVFIFLKVSRGKSLWKHQKFQNDCNF